MESYTFTEGDYDVTYRVVPEAIVTPDNTKNLFALWTAGDEKVELLKLTSTYESEAKEYENNELVVSKWWKFSSPGPTHGCTKIGPFETKNVFVLTVNESEPGEMMSTEIFVMSSMDRMKTYISQRFIQFVESRCSLCAPTEEDNYSVEKELCDVLTTFDQTGKTHFGACDGYFDFFSTMMVI